MASKTSKTPVAKAAAKASKPTAPEGYEELALQAPSVEWDVGASIEGTIVDNDYVEHKGTLRRILLVDINGDVFRLWESAGLRMLFGKARKGMQFIIENTEVKKLPGAKTLRLFTAAIKGGSGPLLFSPHDVTSQHGVLRGKRVKPLESDDDIPE